MLQQCESCVRNCFKMISLIVIVLFLRWNWVFGVWDRPWPYLDITEWCLLVFHRIGVTCCRPSSRIFSATPMRAEGEWRNCTAWTQTTTEWLDVWPPLTNSRHLPLRIGGGRKYTKVMNVYVSALHMCISYVCCMCLYIYLCMFTVSGKMRWWELATRPHMLRLRKWHFIPMAALGLA